MERTFIMIKPDGVQRGLVGRIIRKFEDKDFVLKGLKLVNVDSHFAEQHYADSSGNANFKGLIDYITSGPVVAMVWEGRNVVVTGRKLIGTIRGNYTIDTIGTPSSPDCADSCCPVFNVTVSTTIHVRRNVIHDSDAIESARKEIALWFP